jgi:Glycosyl-transferase for dystroglycan
VFLRRKGAEKGSERAAFVLPEYELIRGFMPDNKAELLSHVVDKKVKARGNYPEARASLKLEQWQTYKASSSKFIHVAYKLEKFNFGFQPVMITKKNGPFFDERYEQDGMAKFSQVRNVC